MRVVRLTRHGDWSRLGRPRLPSHDPMSDRPGRAIATLSLGLLLHFSSFRLVSTDLPSRPLWDSPIDNGGARDNLPDKC